ncbi:N-acetylmuramoyl-L-alanine amidase [Butyrivibrio fibrisolvens 16/4]|nr:N-acetylmuramoyl-L-alanine amidase [Butyrivibrio fibrisolvens 16/4]
MKNKRICILISIMIALIILVVGLWNRTISVNPEPVSSQNFEVEQENQKANLEISSEDNPKIQSHIVCIDPGHQQRADMKKEPIGPGATKKKPKVDGGTIGKYTNITEYQLNLDIALKLQTELESRGYTVVMTRTTNDVNISNSERAIMANEAGAEAFVRIHADGSDIQSVQGASTICQSPDNPYNGALYESSRRLSECVLEGVVASTGCKKRQILELDTMSGINWSQVPNTIIEVGYLTNKAEEAKLVTEDYQQLLAKGIADGIDKYFKENTTGE